MLSPCFLKTTSSICSSAFSIGPSITEEPPHAAGQIQVARRVSFSAPATKRVFAHLTRLLFTAGALLFILTSGAPIAGKAQPADGSKAAQSAWSKLCFDAPVAQSSAGSPSPKAPAPGETVGACYTYVDIRDQATGIVLAIIGVLQAPALDRARVVAFLPIVEVPSEGYVLFQDGTRIKLSRDTCDQAGCYGAAELSPDLLGRIKAAKALSFGKEVCCTYSYSVPLPCCGFTEAFAGQPVHASAHDEMQRKILDVLKFRDLVQ